MEMVEEPNCKRREAALAPHSINSSEELGSTKLVGPDDEQQENKCQHFSIRGYVAEVRKTDMKLCWPFNVPYGHAPNEQIYAIPPLPVRKFRWWNCQYCPNTLNQSNETVISNGAVMSIQTDRKKTQTSFLKKVRSNGNATVTPHPSYNQQESEDNYINGRFVEAKCSTVIGGECQQSLRCMHKIDESVAIDLIEEGSSLPKECDNCCKENQNQPGKLTLRKTEGRACQQGQAGCGSVGGSASTHINPVCGEDGCKIVNAKTKVLESIHEIADAATSTEVPISQRFGESSRKKKPCDSLALKCLIPVQVAAKSDAASAIAGNLSKTENAADSDKHTNGYLVQRETHALQCASIGDLHRQKARKSRLLNDILQSEDLLMSEKVCNLSRIAKASQTKKITDRMPRLKATYLNQRSHTYAKRTMVKPMKRKGMNEASNDEDKGSSLMHWLKMSKKSIAHKVAAGTKDNMSGGLSKDVSAKNHGLENSGPRELKQNPLMDRKQNIMQQITPAQFCFAPQQDSMKRKGKMIAEDMLLKKLHSKSIHPKLTEGKNVQKSFSDSLEVHDNTFKNDKRRKRASQVGYKDFPPKHILKESSVTCEKENIADYHGPKKFLKKQRTTLLSEHDESDDFPMDIVELLAKNQHERHLTNAEAAAQNLQHLSGMAERIKECNILTVTEGRGNSASDVVLKSISKEAGVYENSASLVVLKSISKQASLSRHKENIARSTARSDREQHFYSSNISKQNSLINMNSGGAGLYTVSQWTDHPMTEAQSPVNSSNSSQFVYKFQEEKIVMQDPGSAKRNNNMKSRSLCRTASQMLGPLDFGVNKDLADADFTNASQVHFPPGKLVIGTNKADSPEPVDLTNDYLLLRNGGGKSSNRKQRIPPATSSVGQGNLFVSRLTRPPDSCSNEAIPAMHLLNVMDPAASSHQPPHSSMNNNPTGFIHQPDFYENRIYDKALGLENCVKTSDACRCPLTVGKPDQDEHSGYLCRPIRPIPRLGVLGSVLQQEISNFSNSSREPFGFKGGCSNQLTSIGTERMEKEPTSFSHTKALIEHTSIPRNANFAQVFSSMGSLPHVGRVPISDRMSGIENITRDGAVQLAKGSCIMEVCVLSRNPADFSLPDEDNIYMRGAVHRRPKKALDHEWKWCTVDVDGQKRQKKMKLSTLKRLNEELNFLNSVNI